MSELLKESGEKTYNVISELMEHIGRKFVGGFFWGFGFGISIWCVVQIFGDFI